MRIKRNALTWLWLSLLVVMLDQASKQWALRALIPGVAHIVIPGWLNWTLAFNAGAAFSFLAQGHGWQRWFFIFLALFVSVFIIAWLMRTPRRDWRTAAPLCLIIGGAIGNGIDRIRLAQVTDFIEVHYYHAWYYPVFNLADCSISLGAILLIIFGFTSKKA